MDSVGNIYVLDPTEHRVKSFSPAGEFIGSAGRAGRGPGDLREPISMWHDGASILYVVDQFDGISVFETTDGKPVFRSRFAAAVRPRAICGLNGELFVAGYVNEKILHVVATDGGILRSFGELFRPDTNEMIRRTANSGSRALACDPENGRVFIADGPGGLVRAYSVDGRLLWETPLPEFEGSRITLHPDGGGVTVLAPKHTTQTLLPVGRELLIVQARHQERRRDPARAGALTFINHGIVTYVLSAGTGVVIAEGNQVKGVPLMAQTVGGNTVGYDEEPHPQVFILRVAPIARR